MQTIFAALLLLMAPAAGAQYGAPLNGAGQAITPATVTASTITISSMLPGSVIFSTTAGQLSQDNANFFYNLTNHRLGIGTVTPNVPLEVASASVNSAEVRINGSPRQNGGSANNVKLGFNLANSANTDTQFGAIQEIQSVATAGAETGWMRFFNMNSGSLGEKMSIVGSNVGIGNTTPASLLHMSSGTLTIDGGTAALTSSGTFTNRGQLTVSTNTNSPNSALTVDSNNIPRAGVGTSVSSAPIGGTLCSDTYATVVTTTTPANTSVINFSTCTIPANTLARNNDCVVFNCSLTTAANVNSKRLETIEVAWTGSSALNNNNAASNGLTAVSEIKICRVSATAVTISGSSINGTTPKADPITSSTVFTGITATAATSIYCACQNGSASQGDCSFLSSGAVYRPAP